MSVTSQINHRPISMEKGSWSAYILAQSRHGFVIVAMNSLQITNSSKVIAKLGMVIVMKRQSPQVPT